MAESGGRRGGSGQETRRARGPTVNSSGTSLGALPRVVFDLLVQLEEGLPSDPDERRVMLRDMRATLIRAYPHLRLTDVDVAWMQHEEDFE